MQIKTTMRYHLILLREAIIKKIRDNKSWSGCGVSFWDPLYTVGRNVDGHSHFGKQFGGFSKMKIQTSILFNNTFGYIGEGNEISIF